MNEYLIKGFRYPRSNRQSDYLGQIM